MKPNPSTAPKAEVSDVPSTDLRYVGFWARVGAALIDTILIIVVIYPLLVATYGWAYVNEDAKTAFFAGPLDIFLNVVFPALASIGFWLTKQATPGKMAISAQVVDAKTGAKLSVGQSIGRYLGYYVSLLPLGLGILWIAFDARKQGWHDKLAGTVVVRRPPC